MNENKNEKKFQTFFLEKKHTHHQYHTQNFYSHSYTKQLLK